jgi:cardiolipin synthase
MVKLNDKTYIFRGLRLKMVVHKKHKKDNNKSDAKNNVKTNNKNNTEVIFNLPNSLTALRLILAPIFMVLLLNNKYVAAFIVVLIASITDFLDGQIARRFNMQTKFGRILDPIADKVLVFFAIIALLIKFHFPLWIGIIILARDIIILLGGVIFFFRKKQEFLVPNIFGKVSTIFQLTSIIIFIVASVRGYYALWIDVWLYLTVALTLLSGIIYIFQGYNILSGKHNKD